MITSKDISNALSQLGVVPGDIVLVHSALRSLGPVEGGAAGVIAGFEDLLGREGTLVMPTLCQVDFGNSFKTWYMDKPSDVGYLTEFFRKQPYVYRSNNPTHSVAARGKQAYWLTCEHGGYGPHLCPFGEYAFADSSPWLKMQEMGAKVVFIGVTTMYNTAKHSVEARFLENALAKVRDPEKKAALEQRVKKFGVPGVWLYFDGQKMHELLDAKGLIRHAPCGQTELLLIDMKEFCDACYQELEANPAEWCTEETLQWLKDCAAG